MSGSSMRDQLLKLGLAKSKPAAKRKRRKRPQPAGSGSKGGEISLEQAYAQRQRQEKEEKKRTAIEKKLEAQRRKKLNDDVARVAEPAALNVADAEEHRFFEYQGKIRKVYVTADQQAQLNEGGLGIIALRGRYLLVPPAVVAQVADIKPDAVAVPAERAPDLE